VFSSILCPLDFSVHSELALDYAIRLSTLTKGHVTVVHVVEALLAAGAEAAGNRETLTTQTQREIQEMLARLAPGVNDSRLAISIVVGEPSDQILRHIDDCQADLVVMGTQGLEGAKRFMFGSTTERVLRESRVPVLAVPAPPESAKKLRAGAAPRS
jgi:nucleotide-binding universal stress UspA family protein